MRVPLARRLEIEMIAFLVYLADAGRRAAAATRRSLKILADSYVEAQEIRRTMHRRFIVE
jgi:hypothetical protein